MGQWTGCLCSCSYMASSESGKVEEEEEMVELAESGVKPGPKVEEEKRDTESLEKEDMLSVRIRKLEGDGGGLGEK